MILAKVESDDYTGGQRVIAEDIMNLVDVRSNFAKNIVIVIKQDRSSEELSNNQFQELKELFFDSKKETLDGINVILKLEIENIKFSLMLPDEWKLSPTDYNIDKINQSRNFHSIELIY